MKKVFFFALFFFYTQQMMSWGFWAHKLINRMAVFGLPIEMIVFYKKHILYLEEQSVAPDLRRYVLANEANRHYINLDSFENKDSIPHFWAKAKQKFPEDTLYKRGTVPWQIQWMKNELVEAFREKNTQKILKISAEMGHYVADMNVPLHTTKNYDGQFSNQKGIHELWETRLPELHQNEYHFWIGKAEYIPQVSSRIWQNLEQAHRLVPSVLKNEKKTCATKLPMFVIENNTTKRKFSREYSFFYHRLLGNQVEEQLRSSMKLLSDLWYTAWCDAGKPELSLEEKAPEIEKYEVPYEENSMITK